MRKLSWLSLGLSIAVLGMSACSSSNDEQSAQEKAAAEAAQTKAAEATPAASAQTDANAAAQTEQTPSTDNKTTEPTAPQTAVADPSNVFAGRKVYLRGEMNDYGVQEAYELKELESNKFCTVAPLRSDWSPYRFKFADESWTAGTNFGYAVPPAVIREGSAPVQLNPNSRFEELRYEPQEDGIYRFCIEFDKDVPYATVTFMEKSRLTSLVTMDDIMQDDVEFLMAKLRAVELSSQAQLAMAAFNSDASQVTDVTSVAEVAEVDVELEKAKTIPGSQQALSTQHASNTDVKQSNGVM